MTDRELLQQALDALKYHTEHTYPFHLTNVAIEALQKALAQPEQESIQAIADVIDYLYGTGADNDMANRAHFALKQLQINLRDQTALHLLYKGDYEDLLAKPEQEPAAWRNAAICLGEDLYSVGPNGYYDMTAKQWLDWALSVVNTEPSRKEWVGLTEGELIDIKDCNRGFWVNAAKIEQLLKDKNT
jgi:hypothetical protein